MLAGKISAGHGAVKEDGDEGALGEKVHALHMDGSFFST
jgi:hypothetical protein